MLNNGVAEEEETEEGTVDKMEKMEADGEGGQGSREREATSAADQNSMDAEEGAGADTVSILTLT